MRRILWLGFLLAPSQLTMGAVTYLHIVTPESAVNRDDPIRWIVPFGHFQQVYDASLFAALPPGGGIIKSIEFRSDLSGCNCTLVATGTQIELAVTQTPVGSLSPVYAENSGERRAVFLDFGDVTLIHSGWNGGHISPPSGWGPGYSTRGPGYVYDPAKGNLFMDIQNFRVGFPLDAVRAQGMSSVQDLDQGGNSGWLSSDGLVTEFIFEVPEPATLWALASLGLLAVALRFRRSPDPSPLTSLARPAPGADPTLVEAVWSATHYLSVGVYATLFYPTGLVRRPDALLLMSPRLSSTLRLMLLALVSVVLARPMTAATFVSVVTPSDAFTEDGNAYFEYTDSALFWRRYQQVYDASLFTALPPGGADLQEIAFRADAFLGANSGGQRSGIEINASTTSKDSSSLSPVFADNIGLDNARVLSSDQSMRLESGWRGMFTPAFFDIAFDTKAMHYDPARGNLLLDIKGLIFPFGLDAYHDGLSGSVWPDPANPTAETGQLHFAGLVTLFTFAVPEPSPVSLLGLALGLGVLLLRPLGFPKRKEPDVTR